MPRGGKREGAGRKPGPVGPARLELRQAAQGHAMAALETLVEVMRDTGHPPAARISAATALLDRGYGRPAQSITGPDGGALEAMLTIRREIAE